MVLGLAGLSDTADFSLLEEPLADAVVRSVREALEGGAQFDAPAVPLDIFRGALRNAIRKLEDDRARFELFVRFLRDGPYEDSGPVPQEMADRRLTDEETGRAVRFIYHRVVNAFQGSLAELLAVGPCVRLFGRLRQAGRVSSDARPHVGDAALLKTRTSERPAKGADIIFLSPGEESRVHIAGLAEVKSYRCSRHRLEGQMKRQLQRAERGILLLNSSGGYSEVAVERQEGVAPVRIGVVPSSWRLPRSFHLNGPDGEPGLYLDSSHPPDGVERLEEIDTGSWRVVLGWSHEALASAAFEMTFWLMGKIGERVYSERLPSGWEEMSPEEAGRNAAKMMLYYAVLRSAGKDEESAIALYNAYGFGYALGANFKDAKGHRRMLWFDDLVEIASSGVTKNGHYLHG